MTVKQITKSQVAGVLQQLVVRQGKKCAVCNESFKSYDPPVLDHNHKTGYIRGALHRSCNGAEGKVKVKAYRGHKGVDTDTFLIGLGKYLEKHKTPQVNYIHPDHMTEDQKRLARNKKAREARARKKVGK